MIQKLRLNVNLDQIAAMRAARGGQTPDIVRAARLAAQAGADGVGLYLAPDHGAALEKDIAPIMAATSLPFKLEIAASSESVDRALSHNPSCVCIRTLGERLDAGIDVIANGAILKPEIRRLNQAGVITSVCVLPESDQLKKAAELEVVGVELYIGAYCEQIGFERERRLQQIWKAAEEAKLLGLECHVGYGLTYETVGPVAVIPEITALNIGHFLIAEAIFIGLGPAIKRMRALMDHARSGGIDA